MTKRWITCAAGAHRRGSLLISLFICLLAGAGLVGAAMVDARPAPGSVSGPTAAQGKPAKAIPALAQRSVTSRVRPTAIAVSVPATPQWTRGVDGRVHIDYDLLTTNWISATVTLTSVQVLGPGGRVLKDITGAGLTAHTHLISAEEAPTAAIPPSASVATIIDVVLPAQDKGFSPSSVPATLTHRITYELPADLSPTLRAFIGSLTVHGPTTRVGRGLPTVIAAPISGAGWADAVGCCETSKHRDLLYTANGQWIKGETFAIDWLRVRNGAPFSGDGSKNADWYNWGDPIRSVAAGVVVRAVDGRPDLPPNCGPETHCNPGLTTPDSFSGNYVVVRIRAGVYAQYAHLQHGSVAVHLGERVRTGQQLGRLGDSGNSTGPHLHFGLIDGPDFTTANSLPFVFDRLRFDGYIDPSSGKITGQPHNGRREYPLLNSVVTLP